MGAPHVRVPLSLMAPSHKAMRLMRAGGLVTEAPSLSETYQDAREAALTQLSFLLNRGFFDGADAALLL